MRFRTALCAACLFQATTANASTLVYYIPPYGQKARINVYFQPNAPINFSYTDAFEYNRSAYANGEFWYRNNYTDGGGFSVLNGQIEGYIDNRFVYSVSINRNVLRAVVGNPNLDYLLEGTKPTDQFYYADVMITERAAFFIYDPATSYVRITAVPEPLTWALMVVGFGLVGRTMRAKSTRLAT